MARYCKRRRSMPLIAGRAADGTYQLTGPVPALITRYRFGVRRRKPHYVYYHGGQWLRARNCATTLGADGKPCEWTYALEPIASATAYDAYRAQTVADGKAPAVSITIESGRATKATGCKGTDYAGVDLLAGEQDTDYLEDLLDLKPSTRGRKPKQEQDTTPRPAGKHFRDAA